MRGAALGRALVSSRAARHRRRWERGADHFKERAIRVGRLISLLLAVWAYSSVAAGQPGARTAHSMRAAPTLWAMPARINFWDVRDCAVRGNAARRRRG